MQSRRLRLLVATAAAVLACRGPGPSGPGLHADERALVDVYVQITQIEALRSTEPDSVDAALDHLAASYDSTAVRQALARLEQDPTRWQLVFEAITSRLRELEENPRLRGGLPPAARPPGISAPAPATGPSRPRIP